jgi:hypothetical protein
MILAKKISRKEGESPRKKEIPLRLCSSAPLHEQKIECLPAMLRDRQQRKYPLCAKKKKYLAKKGSRQGR